MCVRLREPPSSKTHSTTHHSLSIYHTTNLHKHRFPQSVKNPPACISASVYPSILPTHISFNVIPEDTASFPGEVVNVTDYLYAAASVPVLSGYSTEIFKKINPSRMNSAFLAPSKPSMDHPAVCEQVLAPSLQTHSGRQIVGSCRFSSKLHKQSKLEVQPSLEAKPMWAIHTPVPVWGQWLQPHSPLHTPAHCLSLSLSLICLSVLPFSSYLSHKYRLLALPNTWSLVIYSQLCAGALTEKTSLRLNTGLKKGIQHRKMRGEYSRRTIPHILPHIVY